MGTFPSQTKKQKKTRLFDVSLVCRRENVPDELSIIISRHLNEADNLQLLRAFTPAYEAVGLRMNLLRIWQIGPYFRKFSTNSSAIRFQIRKICPRFPIFSSRSPKSDSLIADQDNPYCQKGGGANGSISQSPPSVFNLYTVISRCPHSNCRRWLPGRPPGHGRGAAAEPVQRRSW
jgi:hypothetical protein